MTSELRPAVEVWWKADTAFGAACLGDGRGDQAAAAVIEADREAVRAEQAAEIERLRKLVTSSEQERYKKCGEMNVELAKYKALAETLAGALELADCALSGANMNMNVVERKVREALREYKEARDAS